MLSLLACHAPAFAAAAPPPPADKPPLGCAHDAYKLLLSNIPLSMTEADLAAVLRQYGHVVQLALAPDNSGVSSSCLFDIARIAGGFGIAVRTAWFLYRQFLQLLLRKPCTLVQSL